MRSDNMKCWVPLLLSVTMFGLPAPIAGDEGSDFLDAKEQAVEKIVREAIINHGRQCESLATCGNPTNCSHDACAMEDMAKAECLDVVNNIFCPPCKQMNLDFGASYVSVAESSDLNSVDTMLAICSQKPLEAVFKMLSNATALSRTYFGSTAGTFRNFPGLPKLTDLCRDFDPRIRPWYRTATSVVKILVVLIDLGASMGNNLPPEIGAGTILQAAKHMAKALLQTLTAQDYISIIAFDGSRVIHLSPSAILVKEHNGTEATELDTLRAELDKQTVEGRNRPSNISAAMLAALPVFDANPQAAKVILVLTDTVFATLASNVTLPTTELSTSKVKVFVYKLRQPQDNDIFLKNSTLIPQLCAVGGHFEPVVKNLENPRLALRHYYSYLANLKRMVTNGRPQYSQVFQDTDATFGGTIITVSKPVFVEGDLIGVAGITIYIESLGNRTAQVKQALGSRITGYGLAAPEVVLSTANCSVVNEPLEPCGSSAAYYAQDGGVCKRDDSRRRTMQELTCCGSCSARNCGNCGPLSPGAIGGIVASVVGIALLVLCLLWFICWRDRRQEVEVDIVYPGDISPSE